MVGPGRSFSFDLRLVNAHTVPTSEPEPLSDTDGTAAVNQRRELLSAAEVVGCAYEFRMTPDHLRYDRAVKSARASERDDCASRDLRIMVLRGLLLDILNVRSSTSQGDYS